MHNKNVVIIDYGLGNLRSVMRGLEAAGARATITGVSEEIAAADCIVLPGVGAFHEGMEQLGPVKNTLCDAVRDKVPLLGICLGMQMLMDSSEEHGTYRGLGFVPGSVRRFPQEPGKKVPHMGWNTVRLAQPENPLLPAFLRNSTCTSSIPIMQRRPRNTPSPRPNISSPLPPRCFQEMCTASSSTRRRAELRD